MEVLKFLRKMVPTNALIGFEENGGFMFGKHNQVRDGCMTLALMLDLLTSSGKFSSQMKFKNYLLHLLQKTKFHVLQKMFQN